MVEYLHIVKYCVSSFFLILLFGFLITIIYIIRSVIKMPKGITWIVNICTFSLFLFLSLSLILGLVYLTPRELMDDANMDSMIKLELSTELSIFISKYAMYPVVVIEVVIYVSLSSHLLWMWYSAGELGTIVNKIFFLQRILGIINTLGWVLDYGIRLYGPSSFSFISTENYCACWIIFYKSLFYLVNSLYFTIAFTRFLCVEYPMEYHNR